MPDPNDPPRLTPKERAKLAAKTDAQIEAVASRDPEAVRQALRVG